LALLTLHVVSYFNLYIPSSMSIPSTNAIYIAPAVLSQTETVHELIGALVVFVSGARASTGRERERGREEGRKVGGKREREGDAVFWQASNFMCKHLHGLGFRVRV
jgi:hypothetical protein